MKYVFAFGSTEPVIAVPCKIGSRIMIHEGSRCEPAIIARIDMDNISLIMLNSGNRWSDPIYCLATVDDTVSETLLQRMLGHGQVQYEVIPPGDYK